MLRHLTAGESHGQGLIGILEGMPSGLEISEDYIAHQLWRRQQGYGRGRRMKIESDRAKILSGVRFGKTLGGPIALLIENKDWENWTERMSVEGSGENVTPVQIPRPGHADLAGSIKYGHVDIRNVLERSSARETATRVSIGTVARKLLEEFGIEIKSHVTCIGGVEGDRLSIEALKELSNEKIDKSPVRCVDPEIEKKMIEKIDEAKNAGDSAGGIFEVVVTGLPVGLGSHVHWDRKLDGRLAQALMSIQAMKGVEIGLGFDCARRKGSQVHDEIAYGDGGTTTAKGYYRKSNNAGGLEGGMTNGEPLIVRVAKKPISTLMRPLESVNMETKEKVLAHVERSDVCAVPAASVIGEAVVAFVLADAFLEKFGGDSMQEVRHNYEAYVQSYNV